ncbi:MAG: GLPGLI family protein [Muribaculaceae bacterium]|nr:GLPGLI family protein [Muribaculaceae bacterium]
MKYILNFILLVATITISGLDIKAQLPQEIIEKAQLPPEVLKNLRPVDMPMTWDKRNLLDTSANEFIYYHFRYDPVSDLAMDSEEILQIAPFISRYTDYGKYRRDSLSYECAKNLTFMMFSEYSRIVNQWPIGLKYSVYTHHNKEELEVTDAISLNYFRYYEPVPDFKWTLHNDSIRQIGPYTCSMATTSFRGRNWTAWYTPEIPIPQGPWKFSGLPGLIVMVRDTDGEHIFKLLRTHTASNPVLSPDKLYSRTERTTFNARKREYDADPIKAWEGTALMPTDANGNPVYPSKDIKRFVNPIEKE